MLLLRAMFQSKIPLSPPLTGLAVKQSKRICKGEITDSKRLDRTSYGSSHVSICAPNITPLWCEIRNYVTSVPLSPRDATPGQED